jgi:hypothetical protein
VDIASVAARHDASRRVVIEFRDAGEVQWHTIEVDSYDEPHRRVRAGEAMARGLRSVGYTARVVAAMAPPTNGPVPLGVHGGPTVGTVSTADEVVAVRSGAGANASDGRPVLSIPRPEPILRTGSVSSATPSAVPVLFIGGWGRCGSTLLDMLLGQVPGVFSAGEVREIWLRGCVENRPCGCGAAFADCPFWQAVGERAYGGWTAVDLDDLLATRYSMDRPWGIPRLLTHGSENHNSAVDRYCDALSRLFDAIREVSGADLIVDSSKIASHALLLRRSQHIDIRVVHLVRDSRGVAYSAHKRVEKPVTRGASTMLPRHGPFAASMRYSLYNGMADGLRLTGVPYTRLRYEDLVDDPAQHLNRILAFGQVRAQASSLDFLSGRVATLRSNHMVDGNNVRFNTGIVTLRRDDDWRSGMPRWQRAAVTAVTYPLLSAYGYANRDGKESPGSAS